MQDMNDCSGFVGRFLGHKYEARYDSILPGSIKFKHGSIAAIEATKDRVYRGDVCKRCGDIVNDGE